MITADRSPFTLAACAEMVYTDLPLLQRIERIAARGLQVEIWDWTRPEKNLTAPGWTAGACPSGLSPRSPAPCGRGPR